MDAERLGLLSKQDFSYLTVQLAGSTPCQQRRSVADRLPIFPAIELLTPSLGPGHGHGIEQGLQ